MLIGFFTLCFSLGRVPLLQPDEGRNAEVAREMKIASAWLVPTYNGVDYLDKPAFFFKAVALSLAAFGDNEAAARLPSSLFAVALAALTFWFCRRVYGSGRVASFAAIIVATMPLYFAHARIVIFDMTLAFFVCAAIFAGYLAEETHDRSRRNWYLLGSVAAGFATLVKGPVGFLIPILVLLVAQPLAGRRGAWKRLFAPLNFVVFFAVTLPWFIGLCIERPDFLHYGLVEETFKRFTSAKTFQRGKPFYYYAVIVATTFFPWSLLLPEAALAAWRERRGRHRADVLCLVWTVLVVVFFSISRSKQPAYILSAVVACGILLARLCDAALTNPRGRAAGLLWHGTMVFALLLLVALATVIWGYANPDKFAVLLRTSDDAVSGLRDHALVIVISGALVLGVGAWGILRRNARFCFLCLALFCPVLIGANATFLGKAMTPRSGRPIAEQLRKLSPETELVALECFPNGVSFYLGRTLTVITKDGAPLTSNYVLSLLKRPQPWPTNMIPLAEFENWLASRKAPVYLIVSENNQERLQTLATARGAQVQQLSSSYFGALLPAPGGS